MDLCGWRLEARHFGDPQQVLVGQCEIRSPEELGPNQLLVAMRLSPINPSDLLPVCGAYPHRTKLPFAPGYEGVGVVSHAGSNMEHLLHRRVLPLRGEGTWRSHVICNGEFAIPVPDSLPDEVAAVAYINPLTVSYLIGMFSVQNKVVVVTGAGSDCAKRLIVAARQYGARQIFAIHRNPRHERHLRHLGAIAISQDDYETIRRTATVSDLAYDCVGGDIGSIILENLSGSAKFVSFGLLSGNPIATNPRPSVEWKRFHLRDFLPSDTKLWQREMNAVLEGIDMHPMTPTKTFPISEYKQALSLQARGFDGKLLIDLSAGCPIP